VNPIKIARIKKAIKTIILIRLLSYFRCIKNKITSKAFVDAIVRATMIFKNPRSSLETRKVTTVSIKRMIQIKTKTL
jgi:hypothetical protein